MDAVLELELVRVALGKATAAQLADLGAALADDDGLSDPDGVALAWARLALGLDSAGDRYALADDRRATALRLARAGGVTSSALARAAGVCPETARLALVALAHAGHLVARGGGRGRVYVKTINTD